MPIVHTVTTAFLPRDVYQRRDRYWPYPRQLPVLETPRARNS